MSPSSPASERSESSPNPVPAFLKDETLPDGAWAFDADVAKVFDDMLRRSIPDYANMRRTVRDLVKRFRVALDPILDIGSSRGESVAPFVDNNTPQNIFHLVECSKPMLDVLHARFHQKIGEGDVIVWDVDLREQFPAVEGACVALSILTLMFVPIEHRQRVVQKVYDALRPGGAFIVVEKVLGVDGPINDIMVDVYLSFKAEMGYTQEQIQRKRLSLEGRLVPVTAKWNEDMLREVGFRHVDCFWRWMNFAGWIAVKK